MMYVMHKPFSSTKSSITNIFIFVPDHMNYGFNYGLLLINGHTAHGMTKSLYGHCAHRCMLTLKFTC